MNEIPDAVIERIARAARRPVGSSAQARARVMGAVRMEPLPRPANRGWGRLAYPRTLSVSPLAGLALAAGLVGVGVVTGLLVQPRAEAPVAAAAPTPPAAAPQSLPTRPVMNADDSRVTFVLVAPHASAVAVVGDFNGWDASATPMERTPTGGTWSVTVPLNPGRHIYSFVVDGSSWVPDPAAPLAPDDGFGGSNSVVLVGGNRS
jgi:hypothetical protein